MNDQSAPSYLGLAVLCWILGILAIAVPGFLLVSELTNPSSGMFRHLGLALVLVIVLPVLNLFSFFANLLYAWRRRWSVGWLKAVLVLQGLVLVVALLAWGKIGLDAYLEERTAGRLSAVYAAVRSDDPNEIERALERCSNDCGREDLDRFLLSTAENSAYRSMGYLLSRGANPTPSHFGTRSYRTCEGLYLPSLNSLEFSVVRGDPEGVELLLPTSDERGLRKAAWLAARFDRLELLQRLFEAGVPLSLRGRILNENRTLLNAAASGAALGVGAWLLEEQRFNPDGDPDGPDSYRGETPLASLVRFAGDVPDSPRMEPFLGMLLAHGADIEGISPATGKTALQTAVDGRALSAVDALLEAGASLRSLTAEDRARLQELRRTPPADRSLDAGRPGCIP